jgi:phage baseplate assembly protein V
MLTKFFDNDNILEVLKGLIKIGEVSSVDYAAGTARVVFDDDNSLVSNDLQVLQKNTFQNKDYSMPDIGEDVVCLFLPSGSEEGFILGSVYAGEITPPESSGSKRTVVFSDETKISYDRETHTLSAVIGGTSIVADGEAVTINGASKITGTAPQIELNGAVTINGDVTVNGAVTANGDVIAAGISGATHTHIGNLGSPTSAPQ